MLGYTETRDTVVAREDIASLRGELSAIAREELLTADSLKYHPLSDARVIGNLTRIGESLANLQEHDSVSFISASGVQTMVNTGFRVSQDAVEKLLTKDRYTHVNRMILKVKKPDYLGSSRWELRHEKQVLEAHIEDEEWIHKFRTRVAHLSPGDALNAEVRSEVLYGYDGEVIRTKYDVVKVYGVVESDGEFQGELLPVP